MQTNNQELVIRRSGHFEHSWNVEGVRPVLPTEVDQKLEEMLGSLNYANGGSTRGCKSCPFGIFVFILLLGILAAAFVVIVYFAVNYPWSQEHNDFQASCYSTYSRYTGTIIYSRISNSDADVTQCILLYQKAYGKDNGKSALIAFCVVEPILAIGFLIMLFACGCFGICTLDCSCDKTKDSSYIGYEFARKFSEIRVNGQQVAQLEKQKNCCQVYFKLKVTTFENIQNNILEINNNYLGNGTGQNGLYQQYEFQPLMTKENLNAPNNGGSGVTGNQFNGPVDMENPFGIRVGRPQNNQDDDFPMDKTI